MKYRAVIETDDFEDFEFFEDGSGKYIMGIDAGSVNNAWIPVYFTECEQEESILNKIRAEIDRARFVDKDTMICKNALASGLEVAMQIIDKYRSEVEVEE